MYRLYLNEHITRMLIVFISSQSLPVLSCLVLQGTILIAVNPLQKVADPDMSEFMNRSLDPEAPHPYAIAEVGWVDVSGVEKVLTETIKNRIADKLVFGF